MPHESDSPDASRPGGTADAEALALALAAARLGDWSWDVRTDVVTLSTRAAAIFGIPEGPHMTWTAMRALLHPSDRDRARAAVEDSIKNRCDYAIDYRLVNGDRERWVSVRGRGRYDGRGDVVGMLGVVQEITGDRFLVRVDDAVRALTNPEDITYTAARVLGQHLDVDRCAYAFVEADEDTFTLTGNYTRGVPSIVGRYRFRQFGAECLRLMRAGLPYVVDDSHADPRIDADDRASYVATAIRAVICVPIIKEGRFVAAMAVHANTPRTWPPQDVELVQQVASRCWESIERARVEHERQALLEAAQSANRAKDEFLAMLGHELRNPLAPIVTALRLMSLRGDRTFERERTVIERQVEHLTRLVDDLLDVSRIARAQVELRMEVVEISRIVRQAIEVASPLLEAGAHALEVRVAPEGLQVEGDPARLTQVVSNLLTNASKYTPPGGRIEVTASAAGDSIVLRVRDSGIGISPDVLPRVFELFVQGRQTIDRAQGGLGLGLTIVRNLVERHGGTVTAHSEGEGRGTEMVVTLPKARRAGAQPPIARAPAKAVAAPAGMAILVVDDNEDAADLLAEALELQGCQVHVAHDGPSALEWATGHRFDAAVLDIGLPVMDGYELAARLRQLPGGGDARLCAITGYGQDSDRKRALDAGFDHHLVKPIELEALDAVLAGLPGRAG